MCICIEVVADHDRDIGRAARQWKVMIQSEIAFNKTKCSCSASKEGRTSPAAIVRGHAQGGSNGVKKCDMEDPNVGESIIGFKMDINNMQCYHIE